MVSIENNKRKERERNIRESKEKLGEMIG